MKLLVSGGAGYIGSHMVLRLLEDGHEVVVLDDLSSGHRDAVRGAPLVQGDVADRALLDRLFAATRFDAVLHFAGFSQVAESVRNPGRYYRNNVGGAVSLLDAMAAHGVGRLVFSSSAAIFGEPRSLPIDEAHPAEPLNPYGRSKLLVESVLPDYERAFGLRCVALRYFNAAGAHPLGLLGERHEPESHLIPLVLRAAAGALPAVTLFGEDYDTPDGTAIRDYVHVEDLCRAHALALARLADGAPGRAYNLGNGEGYSVRQVIDTARRVTRRPIRVASAQRRAGDPARLVADAKRARSELDWQPRYAALDTIIAHAWAWERRASAAPRALASSS
jgi:UDP-glucose 4-epimerase